MIDAQLGFVGTDPDIEESIVTFPKSVGEAGWRAVEKIKRLVETARKNELTIIFTRLHLDKKSRSYTSFGSKTDLCTAVIIITDGKHKSSISQNY